MNTIYVYAFPGGCCSNRNTSSIYLIESQNYKYLSVYDDIKEDAFSK